jgi:TRAP-type C4-dicarboxylate transport system permease small subunit
MKRRRRFMLGLVFLVMLLAVAAILIYAGYRQWDR